MSPRSNSKLKAEQDQDSDLWLSAQCSSLSNSAPLLIPGISCLPTSFPFRSREKRTLRPGSFTPALLVFGAQSTFREAVSCTPLCLDFIVYKVGVIRPSPQNFKGLHEIRHHKTWLFT